MTNNDNATMYRLGDRGQTIVGPANDIRGREVNDRDGEGIAKVAELLVDDREEKVRFLLIEHGGFLGFRATKTLLPVDAITKIAADEVFINQSRERVATAPRYAPTLVNDRPHHSSVYDHYGIPPYWGQGYIYSTGMWGQYPGTQP